MTTHPFQQDDTWNLLKNQLKDLAEQEIAARFNKVDYELKQDGSLLTEADTAMQKQLKTLLQTHWPQYAFVGEEANIEQQQAALEHPQGCWIVDPIDGTTNFANGLPFFSVSLALMVEGEIVMGMVYDPDRKELFAARKDQGAELNGQSLCNESDTQTLKRCVAIIDFKRLSPPLATALATQPPYASQRSFGSVALDWCWIAAGRGQIYLHGNQSIWDYAAGWLILQEAQGASCTLDGETVLLRKICKRSAVAAVNPATLKLWHTHLQSAAQTG